MAVITLQHTSIEGGDTKLYSDGVVLSDDVVNDIAVVSEYTEKGVTTQRIDLENRGIFEIHPDPFIATVKMIRIADTGGVRFNFVLDEWASDINPSQLAMAFYGNYRAANPSKESELFTAEGEEFGEALWTTLSPPGVGIGNVDVYAGFIYQGIIHSIFTMYKNSEEQIFTGGGDYK